MNVPEIYADTMIGFAISKNGKVAKLTLASERVDASGKVIEHPVLVLTMNTDGMKVMLDTLIEITGQKPTHGAQN